jgi:hypothetical protein
MDYSQIIQNALEILFKNLEPLIQSCMGQIYGNEYAIYMEYGPKAANLTLSEMKDHALDFNNNLNMRKYKDILFYLNAVIKNWDVFKGIFNSNYALCLCHSIKHFRNKWAHQSQFTMREIHRFIDECEVLLEEFHVKSQQLDFIRKKVLEIYYQEEVKNFSQVNSNNSHLQNNFKLNLGPSPSFNQTDYNDYNLLNNHRESSSKSTEVQNNSYNYKYNDLKRYHYQDHEMSEGFEELTESLLDHNYNKVINDKNGAYKDYNIYLYDQQSEEREFNNK